MFSKKEQNGFVLIMIKTHLTQKVEQNQTKKYKSMDRRASSIVVLFVEEIAVFFMKLI